jgi:hypothetical protein
VCQTVTSVHSTGTFIRRKAGKIGSCTDYFRQVAVTPAAKAIEPTSAR